MNSEPSPPESLPKYIADGLPKQDVDTLRDAKEYIEDLLEYKQRPVEPDDLPDSADPIEQTDSGVWIVEEKVKCGDDSCKCASGYLHGPYKYKYYRDESGTLHHEYAENE